MQRLTDDNGKTTQRPPYARAIDRAARLLWIGPTQPHRRGEFFLDGRSLGQITLDEARQQLAATLAAMKAATK